MKYAEHAVRASLAARIECIWSAEDPEAPVRAAPPERVLPDGCVEWIFHLGTPYADYTGGNGSGRGRVQPASFVAGPTTRPLEIAPTGPVSTLGVRFRPGGARGLLPPLDLFAGAFPTPREVWGSEAGSIEDEVASARDLRSRRAALERFLEKRRARMREEVSDARLSAAVGLVLASRGRASVAGIARRVGCSPRQIERAFAAGVGLTPKELSRIARFQNVLRLSGRDPGAGWADLAARCGYADQSHLVREFKALSGATPASREATAGALARYFIDPARLDALLSPAPGRVAFLQDAPRPTA